MLENVGSCKDENCVELLTTRFGNPCYFRQLIRVMVYLDVP